MYKKIEVEIVQPDIVLYSDIVYSNPFNSFLQESIPLNINLLRPFYNLRKWEKRPLLVWVCGGAFRASTPARNIPELVEYAKQGYVVASVGYRVVNDAPFPAQIQDVKAAIRFLKHHHDQYGIDAENVVIAGHSAGAYLAAMVTATDGVELFDTKEWDDVSSSVNGAVCMSGGDLFLVDREKDKDKAGMSHFIRSLEEFLACTLENKEQVNQATPSRYLSKDMPPVLLIHGEKDEMIPIEINQRFYQELTKAGVETDFYEVKNAGHGTVELRQPDIQKIILDFLNRTLR